MTEMLPLFPLGTVLYPGLVLPLNIFEERYRQLIRDLRESPQPQRFGVIAIREGRETGVTGVSSLYDVGCLAMLREVEELPDGRYEVVTVGTDRFRLHSLDSDSKPYLRGEVELLDEPAGDEIETPVVMAAVQRGFRTYLDVLASRGPATISVPELPDEPILLSYLVAASVIIDLPQRQALLAQPDALSRLTAERTLLAKETAILRSLGSTPAPDLRSSPYNPN
jgi:Lon protease-like protein